MGFCGMDDGFSDEDPDGGSTYTVAHSNSSVIFWFLFFGKFPWLVGRYCKYYEGLLLGEEVL